MSKSNATTSKQDVDNEFLRINTICALENTCALLIGIVRDDRIPDEVRVKAAKNLISSWEVGCRTVQRYGGVFIPYVSIKDVHTEES